MGELLNQTGTFNEALVGPETSFVSAAGVMLGAATWFAERFGSGGEPITAAAIQEVSAGPLTEHIPASCAWDSTQGAEGGLRTYRWWGEDKENK